MKFPFIMLKRCIYSILSILPFLILGCSDQEPIIEFKYPDNESVFIADTTITFDVHTKDNDGVIVEWECKLDGEVLSTMAIQPPDPYQSFFQYFTELDLVKNDEGEHTIIVIAKDDNDNVSEAELHYIIVDDRSKFVGNWHFYTERYKWNMNAGNVYDTIDFEGSISKGNADNELVLSYSSVDDLQMEINKQGIITDISGFDITMMCNVDDFKPDSININITTPALGAGTRLKIKGSKH